MISLNRRSFSASLYALTERDMISQPKINEKRKIEI